MKHKTTQFAFIVLLMFSIWSVNFVSATACESPGDTTTVAKIRAAIAEKQLNVEFKKIIEDCQVTGASVALVYDQEVVWSASFGMADRDAQRPVTGDTLFRIGSVSKLFTATAIMQLVEQGKIDLDQPLQTYIPEFSVKSSLPCPGQITVRSLLTHHSGLPGDLEYGFHSATPEYFTSVLQGLKEEYIAYPPNYIYAYSNLGYSLLGIVIERVTGQKFNDYLEAAILKPLTMQHSSFVVREAMKPYLSKGYSQDNLDANLPIRDLPAGAMYSSVNELSHFLKMVFANGGFRGQNLLKKATLNQMLTPQNAHVRLDLDNRLGLAWHLYDSSGLLEQAGKVAEHGGDVGSFHSSLVTLPESKLGAVVLTNSDTGQAIATYLSKTLLRLAYSAKTGQSLPELKAHVLTERPMTAPVMKQYEGDYALGIYGGLLSIQPQGASWCAIVNGVAKELRYHNGGWFSIPDENGNSYLYYQFSHIDGIPVVIQQSGFSTHKTVIGEKVLAPPLPQIWKQRSGQYRAINDPSDDSSFELTTEGNLILVEQEIVLTPLSNNLALIRGLGRSAHEVVQFKRVNGREIILYSGYQYEKVKAETANKRQSHASPFKPASRLQHPKMSQRFF